MPSSRYSENKIRIAVIEKGDRGHAVNRSITWGELIDRLASPKIDKKYTLKEYKNLPIDVQNNRKDVGSFVGGPFRDGLRRMQNLIQRSVVTLDIDQATAEQIEYLKTGESGACKYEFFGSTTRKHRKKKPRWRLVFPLTRPLEIEEYGPLSRILAATVFAEEGESMDAIDDVSYRPAQVMYWPSVCKGAPFETIHNKGKLLDPDAVLEDFGDWRDWTQLPYSELRGQKRPTTGQKAEDPTEKTGIIGAFCRAYDVEAAIAEYLPDIYTEGDEFSNKPRYTYVHGSSSNGAVVEDDGLFLYSHHGTDPCAERLVNAFDLVRIHKFGELDSDAPEDATPTELPSFKEMVRLCKNDEAVLEELPEDEDYDYEQKSSVSFSNLDDEAEDEDEEDQPRKKKTKKEKSKANLPDDSLLKQSRHPAPTFPVDALGKFWANRATLWSQNSAAPIDYTAMSILVGAASVIGNSRWVQAKAGWREPPVLWCTLVGRPSSNKSPALGALSGILSDLEQEWLPMHAEDMRLWETERRRASIKKSAWEAATKEAVTKGEEIDEMPPDAIEPAKPMRRRAVVGDITLESLMHTHAANPRGFLNLRDEMSGWFANLSRYNSGSDRPAWLEAYGGRPYFVDRVKHDGKPLHVRRFSVSLLGGVQPDRLLDLLKSADDGLQARFMFSWPEFEPKPLTEGEEEDTGALRAFRRLSELDMDISPKGDERPVIMPLSRKAWRYFKNWAFSRASEEVSASDALQSAFGKANGLVLRLALVLELLWWSADLFGVEDCPERVSLKAIKAAIRLREEYVKPMQVRVFAHVGKSEAERNAALLAKWILTERPDKISTRSVVRDSRIPGMSDPKNAMAAIDFLINANWIAPIEAKSTGKGGRPKREFEINKKVYDLIET